MMTFHIFFFLFVKKCPGGECISVSDFFPVVFCSIGFPIEKHKKFRSKEKTATIFLLLFRSMKFFFFRNSIHLSSFFFFRFSFLFFRAMFECRSWKLQQRGNILCEFAIAKTTGRTSLPSTLCHRYELEKKI